MVEAGVGPGGRQVEFEGVSRLLSPAGRSFPRTVASTGAESERWVARLRLVAIPIFALGETLPHPDPERVGFYLVLALYALFAGVTVVLAHRRPAGERFGVVATGVDVVAVASLAALSGGAFSPLRSAFFVLPVAVAFRFRPTLTAGAAAATLLAYLAQALTHASAQSPHAATEIAVRGGFLVWIGLSAVVLSVLLERRTRRVAELSSLRERLEVRYRELFQGVPLGLFRLDARGRLLDANPALLELLGHAAPETSGHGDLPGLPFPSGDRELWRRLAEEGRLRGVEFETGLRAGDRVWLRTSGRVVLDEQGRTVGYEGSLEDVSERRRAEQELAERARQQAAVAELAQTSLAAGATDAFLGEAVTTVARTLGVEHSKVLELQPGGREFLLRAGVGWREGLVGHERVTAAHGSQAGYTLLFAQPVVTEDLALESRFDAPPLLLDHGVCSGMSVVIGGLQEPYGVLGAHARSPRRFSADDVRFLQAVAGLLAAVIGRARADASLADSRERFASSRRRLLADALTAEERVRQLLAESLHDEAIQSLLTARQDLAEARGGDARALERADAALGETLRDLREAVFELDPRVYVQAGFEQALRAAALRAARHGRFELRILVGEGPYPHERLLLGIARQLLANVAQHSAARRVALRVARRSASVVLTIADDGRGFALDTLPGRVAAGHIGLASQRERVESSGGRFRIRSAPGRGTGISVELPF